MNNEPPETVRPKQPERERNEELVRLTRETASAALKRTALPPPKFVEIPDAPAGGGDGGGGNDGGKRNKSLRPDQKLILRFWEYVLSQLQKTWIAVALTISVGGVSIAFLRGLPAKLEEIDRRLVAMQGVLDQRDKDAAIVTKNRAEAEQKRAENDQKRIDALTCYVKAFCSVADRQGYETRGIPCGAAWVNKPGTLRGWQALDRCPDMPP